MALPTMAKGGHKPSACQQMNGHTKVICPHGGILLHPGKNEVLARLQCE